ncbi:outer membrane beta-barrel protein [Hymenobacter roseosalivarius]|uniref:outer membrane beta-barrel protein n=1 Tax=Hymenobacter roseosalivarius TaxID=89967 RepID=UPI0013566529|nr:outer membrane beta-barrel protein [Hymenobacter roseosalivarius]
MLKNVFSACPAVSAKTITRFDEAHLVEAVLRYNQQCQTSRPAQDLRPAVKEDDRSRVVMSLRVGAGLNTVSYDQNARLNEQQAQATSGLAAALQVRLATKRAISLESGLQYAHKKSTFSQTSTVPNGFRNAGEQLPLASTIEFTSIQAPLVLRYTVGQGRLQPYLFGGALVGGHLARETLLGLPATVYTPPMGTEPGVIDQRQKSQSVAGRSFAVSLGGHFGAGVLLSKGRRAPLLEVYYDSGREIFETPYMGAVHYRTLGAMLGMEF